MALILREGDYVPDGKGGFVQAGGAEEVLERVLWKLSVRRGSFPFLPGLGSRLHLLDRVPPAQREAVAGQYIQEALADEAVTVEEVALEGAVLTVRLTWQEEELTAVVEMGGTV